jgi:hypothetical protein
VDPPGPVVSRLLDLPQFRPIAASILYQPTQIGTPGVLQIDAARPVGREDLLEFAVALLQLARRREQAAVDTRRRARVATCTSGEHAVAGAAGTVTQLALLDARIPAWQQNPENRVRMK